MEQEDKDLLLRDLCARLPYGVKCYKMTFKPELAEEVICMLRNGSHNCVQLGTFLYRLEHIKPYLFPLSSMTEEQKNQLTEIWDADMNKALDYAISGEEGLSDLFQLSAAKKVINWFIKNHFDFQGLIPKELAIDCTNLNVY